MIAAVTAGMLDHERERHVDQRDPGLVGELAPARRRPRACAGSPGSDMSNRAGMRSARVLFGDVLALAVAAAQPAAGERAPGDHAHAVALAHGQHVALDAAHEQRVRRLLADESLATAPLGDPLRLHDLVGGERRRADVADLARRGRGRSARRASRRCPCPVPGGGSGRGRSSRCRGGAGSPRPRARSSAASCRAGSGSRPSSRAPWSRARRRRGGP